MYSTCMISNKGVLISVEQTAGNNPIKRGWTAISICCGMPNYDMKSISLLTRKEESLLA
jgi:hypothetical protein